MSELLSPAGNFEKMITAFEYGADAVYLAGQRFGLRAFAGNFSDEEIFKATDYAHKRGKKIYVTLNIIAHESDFNGLKEYLKVLEDAKVDAVIVADVGIALFVKQYSNLELHISTQANILNSHSALFFAQLGATRLVLARELSFNEIKQIRQNLPKEVELEVFVHGAMCISYSGRCLLSNYMANRDSNRGMCSQPCRWEYTVTERNKKGNQYEIKEDERGTYIFNSKDMNLMEHIHKLLEIGIESFKIEGRMKSEYYVANVTNAYRRTIDLYKQNPNTYKPQQNLIDDLNKSSHRQYTSGFMFYDKEKESIKGSFSSQTHKFVAVVLEDAKDGKGLIQQRNRFKKDDVLEVLSSGENWNKTFIADAFDMEGASVPDAKYVEQKLYLKTDLLLKKGDMLRVEYKEEINV